MAEERELKLEFGTGDAARLKRSALFGPAKDQTSESLTSVYYDTPKHRLVRDGFTLRVRHTGGGFVQTLKGNRQPGIGTHVRDEWEWPVAGAMPDLSLLAGTPVAHRVARPRFAAKLAPMFETRVERTTRLVARDGATVEIALDEGMLIAGDRSAPIRSLELELKSGPAEALYRLAQQLPKSATLDLDVRSKSERGYALLKDVPEIVFKAESLALPHDATVGAAARIILKSCLRQFRLNVPGVLAEENPEALHQARVAIRRCRSALSFFKPVLNDAAFEQHKAKLRTLSQALGHARDLDVFLAADDPARSPALRDKAAAERDRRYASLRALLGSPDHRNTMLAVLAWIEHGAWSRADRVEANLPTTAFAAARLDLLRRKLRKQGRDLAALSDHDRHQVRIAAKRLRYVCEFLGSTIAKKPTRKRHATFVEALEALQKELGALNDKAFGHDLIEALDPRTNGSTASAAPSVAANDDAARTDGATIRQAEHAYRAFCVAKPFWA